MSFCFMRSAPVTVQSYPVCLLRMEDWPLACASSMAIMMPTALRSSVTVRLSQNAQHVRLTTKRA